METLLYYYNCQCKNGLHKKGSPRYSAVVWGNLMVFVIDTMHGFNASLFVSLVVNLTSDPESSSVFVWLLLSAGTGYGT